jgi:hypothetical protein
MYTIFATYRVHSCQISFLVEKGQSSLPMVTNGLVEFSVSMLKYTTVESLIEMLHLATGKPGDLDTHIEHGSSRHAKTRNIS